MRHLGSFALRIQRASSATPTRVCITLVGAQADPTGSTPLSADCITLDELEGAINRLQDELDILRAEARRAFANTVGHG